jgi:hypothetical protein
MSLVLVVVIQLACFLGPMGLGFAGLLPGQIAAFTGIVAWFAVGTPLSYAALDHRKRTRVRKVIRARAQLTPVRVQDSSM